MGRVGECEVWEQKDMMASLSWMSRDAVVLSKSSASSICFSSSSDILTAGPSAGSSQWFKEISFWSPG